MTASLRKQGRPKGSLERIALPVAGDDQRAKGVVIGLVDEIGFDGIDAGGLDASSRQQLGSPSTAQTSAPSGTRGLTVEDHTKLSGRRDTAVKLLAELRDGHITGDVVQLIRSLAGLPDQFRKSCDLSSLSLSIA